jgi:hypothetical protein
MPKGIRFKPEQIVVRADHGIQYTSERFQTLLAESASPAA